MGNMAVEVVAMGSYIFPAMLVAMRDCTNLAIVEFQENAEIAVIAQTLEKLPGYIFLATMVHLEHLHLMGCQYHSCVHRLWIL